MEIVLTFTGSRRPRYLMANIQYLRKTFPEHDLLLLLDNPKGIRDYQEFARCVLIEDFSPQKNRIFSHLKHDPSFWGGFWYHTISRFFLIEAYMQNDPKKPLLHVEADVLLLPNFPFESFLTLQHCLAYPVINENQGVASIFYVSELQSIKTFLDFIEGFVKEHPFATDMSLLAEYAKSENSAFILPSLLPSKECGVSDPHLKRSSTLQAAGTFNGIFDGATYGQYLFGVDPRNNLGKRTLFLPFPHHFVNPSSLHYSLQSNDQGQRLVVSNGEGTSHELYCLHVHSKDLRAFSSTHERRGSLLERRVLQSRKKSRRVELVPSLWFFEMPSFMRAIFHISIRFMKRSIMKL